MGEFWFWAGFGLLAGGVAKLILPGKDPGGCLVTILLGIAGAMVGGFFGKWLGFGQVTGFDPRSFALAVAGSLLLLVLYRLFIQRRPVGMPEAEEPKERRVPGSGREAADPPLGGDGPGAAQQERRPEEGPRRPPPERP